MMQRRGKSSFSADDEERLLAFMDVTRELTIKFGAAHGFHSAQYALSTLLTGAIDKLAEHLSGDPKLFWLVEHSAGGPSPRDGGTRTSIERRLHWQELRRKY